MGRRPHDPHRDRAEGPSAYPLATLQAGAGSIRRLPLVAAALILASTATTIFYVWFACPLDLAPDEAHYWDWSRHLDWSYYSKGPLVAWLIRASCELFGPLSLQTTGNLAAAVRLPAALCHGATLAAWYVLAAGIASLASSRADGGGGGVAHAGGADRFRDHDNRSALSRVLVVGARVRVEGDREGTPRSWWFGAGFAVGLGILAKYTMLLSGRGGGVLPASSAWRVPPGGRVDHARRSGGRGGRPSCSGTRGTTGCRSAMSSDRWVAGARAGASGGWAPCSSSAARRE